MTKLLRSESAWILAICVWLWSPFFLLGPFSLFAISDGGDASFPFIIAVTKYLSLGEFWFPFEYGGVDRLAHGMMSPFDHLLFSIFPAWIAYQVNLLVQVLVCLFFGYLLVLRIAPRSASVALLCAAIVSWRFVAGGNTYQMTWAMIPAVLWAVDSLLKSDRSFALTHACAFCMGLTYGWAAHPVFFINSVLPLLFVWFLFVRPIRRFSGWSILGAFVLSAIFALSQDLSAISLASSDSQRGSMQVREGLGDLLKLFDTPIELALFIALVGGAFWSRNALAIRGLAATVAVVVIYLVLFALKLYAPILAEPIQGIRLVRVLFPIPYIAAFASADVLALVMVRRADRSGIPAAAAKWVFPILLVLFFGSTLSGRLQQAQDWVVNGNYAANFRNPVFEQLSAERGAAGQPFRIATHEIPAGIPAAYGLETAGGYATQYSQRYKELWELAMHSRPVTAINILEVYCVSPDVITDPLVGCFDPALLGLLNVRYLVSRRVFEDPSLQVVSRPDVDWSALSLRERILSNLVANFRGRSNYYVYRLGTELPRAFVVAGARSFDSRDDLKAALAAASTGELRGTAFFLREDLPSSLKDVDLGGAAGDARVVASDNGLTLEVDASREGFLIIGTTFSRYMRGYLDGEPVATMPVDLALTGLVVPKGRHKVQLIYDPPYGGPALTRSIGGTVVGSFVVETVTGDSE